MALSDRHFIDADDVRRRMPGTRELFAHVDLVELLDGVPIEMHPSRHIRDRHRATQAADLHCKPQCVFRVVGQKGELFVLHAAGRAGHAAHVKVEIDFPIAASKIARPSPPFVVTAVANLPTSAALRFFERRSSVMTKAGCSSSSQLSILARTRKPETWYASRKLLIGALSGCFFMPENVTRFQPIENVKKPLIRWTYIDIMPSRLPTFFHEEPIF